MGKQIVIINSCDVIKQKQKSYNCVAAPLMQMEKNNRDRVVGVLDFLISNLVIGPLVVFYWRGTWELLDVHLFPESPELSNWVSLIIGVVIAVASGLLQSAFCWVSLRISPAVLVIFSRVYGYVLAFGVVNHWRGVWLLLNAYTGNSWLSPMLCLVIGSGLLFAFRSYRNVLTTPVVVGLDIFPESYFTISTRFNQKAIRHRFLLDLLFSVLVIASLVVVVWRGFWEILNIYLSSDDVVISGCYSLTIGYVLVCLLALGQRPLKAICRKLGDATTIGKVVFEDFVYLLYATVAITQWRGFWLIADELIFPTNQNLSLWLTHSAGFGGLMLMFVSNSAMSRGCVFDGALKDGAEVTMDISYLTYMVSWCKHSKSKEIPEMEAIVEENSEPTKV
ncbi:uncharacterized protein LOC121385781 [Gigantopelta aegis]|uniref:uncharacterized protein LOC121385781 n=1 Tax=Gigantopelta aegis TaxID=1735272 RepID=UPI001B88A4BE|nr:uncharacterized protein LOC121385781 [Gigantopelta aegis]